MAENLSMQMDFEFLGDDLYVRFESLDELIVNYGQHLKENHLVGEGEIVLHFAKAMREWKEEIEDRQRRVLRANETTRDS